MVEVPETLTCYISSSLHRHLETRRVEHSCFNSKSVNGRVKADDLLSLSGLGLRRLTGRFRSSPLPWLTGCVMGNSMNPADGKKVVYMAGCLYGCFQGNLAGH